MPTVKQLRQQAKARKVPKYSRMNKPQLLSALGMSNELKQHKLNTGKSKAIEAQSKNIAKGDATKRAIVKGRLTRAISRELKKAGKDLTQDQKRQIALKAISTEAKKIREGKPEKQKPFGIQKPPHMSVAEYREHLRRKFAPNSSGSRVESIAKKEKKRSEIGSGEFEGKSTAENLQQMEQQGKVTYPTGDKPKKTIRREMPDLSIADLDKSEAMLKQSYGKANNISGDKLDVEWARMNLQNQGKDIHIEDLTGKSAPKRAKARSKNSPRLIEKTVDGRKRTFNRSGSEVVRGRSID